MYLQPVLAQDLVRHGSVVVNRLRVHLFFPILPKTQSFYDMAYEAMQNNLSVPLDEYFDRHKAARFCELNDVTMVEYPDKVFFVKRPMRYVA